MRIDRRTLIGGALAAATFPARAAAQQWGKPSPAAGDPDRPVWPPAEHFALWPEGAPGAPETLPVPHDTMNGPAGERQLWLYGVPEAFVAVYRPAKPNGLGLMTIPGGGYGFVSVQNEGMDTARFYTARGFTVFVLTYRLPGEGWAQRWNVPLQDAQRAMRLIRARAAIWGIDAEKLGIIGFSAGGHLAASLAVGHDDPVYTPLERADFLSARPAWAGLIYPVIDLSLDPKGNSAVNLLGDAPPADIRTHYDTSKRVTARTPPMFLTQALDDPLVDPENSLRMMQAARTAKVPVEAHFFEKGGHGFGVARMAKGLPAEQWPELFDAWVRQRV